MGDHFTSAQSSATVDGHVVIVTRGGWGDIWIAPDSSHPLCQPGDALLRGSSDVLVQYNILEVERLARWILPGTRAEAVAATLRETAGERHSQRMKRLSEHQEALWRGLLEQAREVPDDEAALTALVRRDRTAVTKERNRMTEATATSEQKSARANRYTDDDVIELLVNKDGVRYDGVKNNPKRPGTKAHARFAKLRDGMTVGRFVKEIGGDRSAAVGDIAYGISHGQLRIKPAPKKQDPIKAAAEEAKATA